MMDSISKRSLTWLALGLFAFVLVLQASSYFRLAFSIGMDYDDETEQPAAADAPAPLALTTQYAYRTLWRYTASLVVMSVCMLVWNRFRRWWYLSLVRQPQQQRRRGWWCRIRWVLEHEWCFAGSTRLSLGSALSVAGLAALNGVHVLTGRERMQQTTATTLPEAGDLFDQEYANRFAQLAVVNLAASIALSVRHVSTPAKYPANLRWHVLFAVAGGMCALYHACFQLAQQDVHAVLGALFWDVSYTTGLLMASALVLLVFGSHPLVRHTWHRFFRLSHLIAFAVLLGAGYLHHWAFSLVYAAAGFMWLRDQYWQYIHTAPARVVGLKALAGKLVKLQLQPAFQIPDNDALLPGQFAFVSWGHPSWVASKVYAHPFSISRLDRDTIDDTLTFYVRASGRDTLRLYEMAEAGARPSNVRISAPMGRPQLENGQQFSDFQVVVLVAEGVGITPWISVVQQLGHPSECVKTKKIIVLWTMRNTDTLHAIADELTGVDCTLRVYSTRQAVASVEEGYDIRAGRPDYVAEFEEIRMQHPDDDVALGLCVHDETAQQCGNIARKHSHPRSIWFIGQERFEL